MSKRTKKILFLVGGVIALIACFIAIAAGYAFEAELLKNLSFLLSVLGGGLLGYGWAIRPEK